MAQRDALSAVEGDIVVTPVAGHYAIGRITADAKTQAFIETQPRRMAALTRACALVRPDRRVFLAHGSRHESVVIDRTNLGEYAQDSKE